MTRHPVADMNAVSGDGDAVAAYRPAVAAAG
jgi:hypothetical protein